ncbi:hypothetical protein F4802DRAFT_528408 [Xylaria palmicola]|nr:hypothetical protein F4802DRAFT_528408 [Xylaria palmicola]
MGDGKGCQPTAMGNSGVWQEPSLFCDYLVTCNPPANTNTIHSPSPSRPHPLTRSAWPALAGGLVVRASLSYTHWMQMPAARSFGPPFPASPVLWFAVLRFRGSLIPSVSPSLVSWLGVPFASPSACVRCLLIKLGNSSVRGGRKLQFPARLDWQSLAADRPPNAPIPRSILTILLIPHYSLGGNPAGLLDGPNRRTAIPRWLTLFRTAGIQSL